MLRARVSSPVVLVGHSYGGTLIIHAGTDDKVAALVYITALAPDDTETRKASSRSLRHGRLVPHRGRRRDLAASAWGERLAGDLPEAKQKVVWATQAVPVPDLFTQKLDGVAWRSKPSWSSWPPKIAPSIPNWNAPLRSAWAPQLSSGTPVTSRCSPNRMLCST